MSIILLILLVIAIVAYLKQKLSLYVLAMWVAENEFPMPDKQDTDRLSKKIMDRWFNKK